MQVAPDWQEKEGDEPQGGCRNEQWHAGAENSFAARERAVAIAPCRCGTGSGAQLCPMRGCNEA